MTTEQFDKLLLHLSKLVDAQAAISQGKNRGTFASDQKTDEGRVLKVVLRDWRRLDNNSAVTSHVVTDSFYRFSFFHSFPASISLNIQCLSPAGKWHLLKNLQNDPPWDIRLASNSAGAAECGTFEGNFCAIRFLANASILTTPNNEVSLIAS
jgi:hypothetical protein